MNIFLQELKAYRRSTIIWIVVICVLVIMFLSIYSSFAVDVESARKLLSAYPPTVLAALNLKIDIFFTIYGFFGYLLTFLWLTGAIQAMNLGVSVLSKEIAGKTADFLLSKPVTRFRVMTEKLAAAFTLIVITNIFYIIAVAFSAKAFSKDGLDMGLFLMIAVTFFFVQLFFLAFGFLLAAVVPKIKTVVAFTLPFVFTFFIISAFGGVINLKEVDYITPFKYFDVSYIYHNHAYDPKYLWILTSFVIVCVATSYIVFQKRDMQAVN